MIITECLRCARYRPARFGDCLSCSYLWGGKDRNAEFVRRYLYHIKVPDNAAMANGRQVHEQMAKERGVVEGVPDVVNLLQLKQKFSWSGMVCSPMHGLRGKPDAVHVTWDEEADGRPRLTFTVEEDKGHYASDFWMQLYGYAMILSDPHALLHRDRDEPDAEGEGLPLYDSIPHPFHTRIMIALNIYSTGTTYGPHTFSSDWRVGNEVAENAVLAVRKMRLRALHDERNFEKDRQARFTVSKRRDLRILGDLGDLRLMVKKEGRRAG